MAVGNEGNKVTFGKKNKIGKAKKSFNKHSKTKNKKYKGQGR